MDEKAEEGDKERKREERSRLSGIVGGSQPCGRTIGKVRLGNWRRKVRPGPDLNHQLVP
jgi:hypothetical protein